MVIKYGTRHIEDMFIIYNMYTILKWHLYLSIK